MWNSVAIFGPVVGLIALGAGIIVVIRRVFGTMFPFASGYLAVILSAATVYVLSSFIGTQLMPDYAPILIATFLGMHLTQSEPWSLGGLCLPLATVAGLVAVFSAASGSLLEIAVSLGATGLLLNCAQLQKQK
jgi:hypothetical protein